MSSKFLIYTCCFHQEIYTEILSYLINSFQKTNSGIDFLIYTTGEYKTLIESKCPNSGVKFFEKNFYKSMNQARISKLDIFDYPEIDNYEKVIYFDADSFFVKDPTSMFDAIQEEQVYVVGEGNILHEAEYWGRSLFLKENPQYGDREGVSSCVMGFKNIPAIKKLFIKTKQAFYLDMYQNKLRFYDQPFLNFYFIHNNMCDTQTFKRFVKSRVSAEIALKEELTIVHFAGCPGHGDIKMGLLKEFQDGYDKLFVKTKDQTIFLLQQQMEDLRKKMESLLSSQ
jgi:lipopolysaccharide biosynthesis glycosyltransferase